MSHLSYKQFSDRFGDLGITYWVKFNWLANNGLPKELKLLKGARFNRYYPGNVELPNYRLGTTGKYIFNVNSLNDIHYSYNSLFCSSTSADTFEAWLALEKANFRTNGANSATISINDDVKQIIFEYTPTEWTISTATTTKTITGIVSPSTVGNILGLGGYKESNTPADYELSSFIIKENGKITHCYCPVINTANKVCIYDIISKAYNEFNGYVEPII